MSWLQRTLLLIGLVTFGFQFFILVQCAEWDQCGADKRVRGGLSALLGIQIGDIIFWASMNLLIGLLNCRVQRKQALKIPGFPPRIHVLVGGVCTAIYPFYISRAPPQVWHAAVAFLVSELCGVAAWAMSEREKRMCREEEQYFVTREEQRLAERYDERDLLV